MTLFERIEKEITAEMEPITVKCDNEIAYEGTVFSLKNSQSSLLEMKSKNLILRFGKGYEVEVFK